ncbi:663_t:CDS:2, partial [Scutellospora calospora]
WHKLITKYSKTAGYLNSSFILAKKDVGIKLKKIQDSDLDKQPYINAHSRQLNKNYLSCSKFLSMYQIIKLHKDDAVHTAVETSDDDRENFDSNKVENLIKRHQKRWPSTNRKAVQNNYEKYEAIRYYASTC